MLADHEPEHGVAEKGQRAIVRRAGMLVGVGAVGEGLLEEGGVAEAEAQARAQGPEGVGPGRHYG